VDQRCSEHRGCGLVRHRGGDDQRSNASVDDVDHGQVEHASFESLSPTLARPRLPRGQRAPRSADRSRRWADPSGDREPTARHDHRAELPCVVIADDSALREACPGCSSSPA
jgi:hypothetical protein